MSNIKPRRPRAESSGFTLVELLLAVALVGLLAALVIPALDAMRRRADATVCANNLRQIGVAMLQKVQDNGNVFPLVESDPTAPLYPPDAGALSLLETLRPYGMTERSLRCPADVRQKNFFQAKGTSYEWFPLVDGEVAVTPKIYLPSGVLTLPQTLFPMAADFTGVHRGRQNVLFADGHVRAY